MNDIERRIAAMSSEDKSALLCGLVSALQEDDLDSAHEYLRDWGLEENDETDELEERPPFHEIGQAVYGLGGRRHDHESGFLGRVRLRHVLPGGR